MDFKVAGLNPASFAETLDFQKSSAEVAPISLQDIRSLRQGFEREAETLRPVLGAAEHQSMLIAMYEGTEQLLNRRVPAFAVHEYLEGLKGSAQELRNGPEWSDHVVGRGGYHRNDSSFLFAIFI